MKVYCAIIKDSGGELKVIEPILSETELNVYKKLKERVEDLRQIISVEEIENVIRL